MKKFRLQNLVTALCLVMTAGMWGCNNEDVDNDGPFVSSEPTALTFEATAGTQKVTIKSNRDWSITSSADWLSFTPKTGSGDTEVEVTVLANGGAQRVGTLSLSASTASGTIEITQKGTGGGPVGDPLYYENVGTSVEKIAANWPFVDQFEGWTRGGSLSQTEVTYTGSGASVRAGGASYAPAAGSGFSGSPFIYMGSTTAYFQINKINVTGKTNLTFTCGVLYQSAYTTGPVFEAITATSMKLQASVDGTTWSDLTYTPAGGADWNKVTSEFKVPAGTTTLYIKISNLAKADNNNQYRLDDFTILEGGNGNLIGGGGSDPVNKIYITVAQLRAKGETTIADTVYVKASVISNKDGGNSTSRKNIVISDGAAGIAIRFTADADYAVGTELELALLGAQLAKYQGLLQLNNFNNANVLATGETKVIAAKAITAADLVANTYESMYVAVPDVEVVVVDLTKKMGTAADHVNIGMEAKTGQAFSMFTAKYATFITDNVPQGSGILKGIAGINIPAAGGAVYQVAPQTAADFAGLTGERFGAELSFSFGTPAFSATTIKAGTAIADGKITIPYTAAAGAESYNITVAVGGDAAAGIDPITVAIPKTLTAGNGSIEIPITGTPSVAGSVTFTIIGIAELTTNTVTATVDEKQAAGSFVAEWNMFGVPLWGVSPMTMTSAAVDGVTIGGLTKFGYTTSGSPGNNNWGGVDFSGNTTDVALTAPVKYVTFTVGSAIKVVSLTSLEATIRITKTGPTKTSVQYSFDGTTFKEAGAFEFERPTGTTTFEPAPVDLSKIADLQNVAANKTITIRLVPVATPGTTTGNWYLTSKDATTHGLVLNAVAK